jgi:putative metallohydrolase (TIGR04338 family)
MRDTGIRTIRPNMVLVTIRLPQRRHHKLVDRPTPFDLPHERWLKDRKGGRDSMRGKCYAAEDIVRKQFPEQKTFQELDELARYCRDIMETDWFQRRWPHFTELFVRQKGRSTCYGGPRGTNNQGQVIRGRITISTWGMGWSGDNGGELIVLHELAHAIVPGGHKHSRLWVRTFLELVRLKLGMGLYLQLRKSFENHRVRCNPFRVVSEEMLQRLAACRPAGFGARSVQPKGTKHGKGDTSDDIRTLPGAERSPGGTGATDQGQ